MRDNMKVIVRIVDKDDDNEVGFVVEEIECQTVMEGLQKLHERLNDVANPRQQQFPTNPNWTGQQPRPLISC